jgi:hypothetical protein
LRSDEAGSLYGAPGASIYFLLLALRAAPTADPPTKLTPREAWGHPGAFVFAQNMLDLPPKDLAAELELLAPHRNTRAVAWVDDRFQIASRVSVLWTVEDRGEVAGAAGDLEFGNVSLKLKTGTPVKVSDECLAFEPQVNRRQTIVLERARSGVPGLTPHGSVLVALDGPTASRATFAARWDAYELFRLFRDDPSDRESPARAGDVRYFRREESNGTCTQFVYPTLAAVSHDSEDPTLSFDVELDPGAPFDGERTRMLMVADSVPRWLHSDHAATVSGRPVGLVPLAPEGGRRAGFYFALRPDSSSRGRFVYLAPIGPFALTLPDAGEGVGRRADNLVMCGANGLEYIEARDGDLFDFVPSRPALASATGADRDGAKLLDATFTTSWVDFRLGAAPGRRAYFGQPRAAVNFGNGVIPSRGERTMKLPAAVASLVRELEPESLSANRLPPVPPFPMAPYGGTRPPGGGPADYAAKLLAFEQSVLAPERGALLHGGLEHSGGRALADFTPPDPVFADAEGTPLAGGRTTTPQGFLVDLNDGSAGAPAAAGTWKRVCLARSGAQHLAFGLPPGTATVDARLATTLLRDQVFLVLGDWSRFPMTERRLAVAGFDFELAPGGQRRQPRSRSQRRPQSESQPQFEPQPPVVMVFKFATSQSLADLIADVASWAQPEVFVGDGKAIADAQATLLAALETANAAKGERGDPFGYFRDPIASRPEWTGALSFNGPINGNGMPADLQMLFAGIDGPLRAHHFGVEVNRVTRAVPALPEIEESALFGVVHHRPPASATSVSPTSPPPIHPASSVASHDRPLVAAPPPAPGGPPSDEAYAFTVEELNVAIRNSAVTDFHAQVAVTIPALFGRTVTVKPATEPLNTIRLTGQYQRHGDVGTVTFGVEKRPDAPTNPRFDFAAGATTARVLDALVLKGASLAPVASKQAGGNRDEPDTQVRARVALAGELSFAADPFPGVKGLDLFSYGPEERGIDGREERGIGLSGLALDLSCRLDATGKREGATAIAPNYSTVKLADEPAALRPGSLVATLPITLTGFLQDPEGLDPGKLGALPLNVLELMAPDEELVGGRLPATRIATRPPYALEFRLPLGSLGALADAHASIDAALVLGWGPSTYTPDDDGAGVFVQLPALSAGAFGFNLQGLLKTTFGDANLLHVELEDGDSVYVVLFGNVALSLLGVRLPPRVIVDFILFGGVEKSDGGGAGSLGWSLAATELAKPDLITGTSVP